MTGFPAAGDNFRTLSNAESADLTETAYQAAIRNAMARGDEAKARELMQALAEIRKGRKNGTSSG